MFSVQFISRVCTFNCAECKSFILSKEGVIQGDPRALGMMRMFYAIGILPLTQLQMLKPDSHFIQKLKLHDQRKLKMKQNGPKINI